MASGHDRIGSRAAALRRMPWLWIGAIAAACALTAYVGHLAAERRPAGQTPEGPVARLDPAAFGHRRTAEARFGLQPTPPSATEPLLPAEARGVYAFFDLPEGANVAELTAAWWWNGHEMEAPSLGVLPQDDASQTILWAGLLEPSGNALGVGIGEFEAMHAGVRIARGSFVTAEGAGEILAQPEPPARETTVRSLVFARGVDEEGRPRNTAVEFGGKDTIWAVFEYQGADAGAAFVVQWYCEGQELPPARKEIVVQGERGMAHAWISAGPGQELPPAEYEVQVSYGAEQAALAQGKFRIREATGAAAAPGGQP